MIKIAVDAMGGDNAPGAVVEGCLEALNASANISIELCGPEQGLEVLLIGREYDKARLHITPAKDVITNHDSPTLAIRRKTESSMVVAMDLLKNHQADAFVSAGSTGALLAGGIFRVGRIKGVDRPALAPILPTLTGAPCMLIDSGANVDCKPDYLRQFAIMGKAYLQGVLGVDRPKIGLLNVGTENEKGNELTKAAFPLLENAPIDFYGNIEARDGLSGEVQVIVADGFAGNVFLKATEGTVSLLFSLLKAAMQDGPIAKLGAAMIYPKLKTMKKKLDYQEMGGAVLLGVDGVMIKAHGSSSPKAFASAILQAEQCAQAGVIPAIKDALGNEASLG